METTTTIEQLVIPPRVAKSVDPKPSKTEIIEALATRMMQQEQLAINESLMAVTKQHNIVQDLARTEMLKAIAANELPFVPRSTVHSDSTYWHVPGKRTGRYTTGKFNSVSYTVQADWTPPDRLVRAHAKECELKSVHEKLVEVRCESLTEAKRIIKLKMGMPPVIARENRVAAMLSSPAAVKGLDAMLASLDKVIAAPSNVIPT